MAKPRLAPAPTPAPASAPASANANPAPPRKRSKRILLALVAVALLGGGGAAAWFFLKPQAHPADGKAEAVAAEKKSPPVFVTLEPFTVNLQSENGDHYLQAGIVFQVTDDKAVDAMKTYMPVIRNRLLLLLSSKRPSDLAALDGKQKLVAELVVAARESLPGGQTPERGIDRAFLSSFGIQ